MRRAVGAMLAVWVLLGGGTAVVRADEPAKPAEGKWVSLFNGKDLSGWIPKVKGYDLGENPLDTFRVEDGLLSVNYEKYTGFDGHFGHIFYQQRFTNYRLRLEYRFVGKQCPGGPGWALRNNGIMLHCQDPKTMRRDQDFPVSIECQLLGGDGTHERSTLNVCSPGTNYVQDGKLITEHCRNSSSKTFHGEQWVKAEVEVHGAGKIRHFVNGELVFEYEQAQLDPTDGDAKKLIVNNELLLHGGWISLQAESAPCQFRNIEIQELPE